ncbi:hypothetical protein ACS5PU_01415 [Pedobacter sp. GSP4]|uniref:hypothetical protein n=1 Tax=Pedobacter sp. GSP4 TaxID=3453716 RepID=UPI003EEFE1EF
MKQALLFTLKVTLTTLLFCLPVTFAVMVTYLKLLPIFASNYNYNFNLDLTDALVFIVMVFCVLLFNMRKIDGSVQAAYNKRIITKRALWISIGLFIIYLLIIGELKELSVDGFLITYGPSFLIMWLCMRIFPLHNEARADGNIPFSL